MSAVAALQLNLAGRRLLVVGASSGVGREVVLQLARAGARVVLAARRRERLEAAVATLQADGCDAHAVVCDVRDEAQCQTAVGQAIEALGGLDGFVYAPGVAKLSMLQDARHEDWRHTLDVNLVGAALITAAAMDALRKSQGRAVFVSSYVVRQTLPGVGLYSTSKVGLDGLIEAWRMEAPEVDLTRVVLGNTLDTEFAASWGDAQVASITKHWVRRGLFPAPKMMPLEAAAEVIATLFAFRGYVDDIAVMPRLRDAEGQGYADAGPTPERHPALDTSPLKGVK